MGPLLSYICLGHGGHKNELLSFQLLSYVDLHPFWWLFRAMELKFVLPVLVLNSKCNLRVEA